MIKPKNQYVRLKTLHKRHKELDNCIKKCYTSFTNQSEVKKMKVEKLSIKDEIYNLENQLKE